MTTQADVLWYDGDEAVAIRRRRLVVICERLEQLVPDPHRRANLLATARNAVTLCMKDAYAAGLRVKAQDDALSHGLCADREAHRPHVHDSATLGTFWCTANQHDREPGRSDRAHRQREREVEMRDAPGNDHTDDRA